MMSETSMEDYIESPNGYKLFTKTWKPETDSPKALVFIVHGYGEYSLHYEDYVVPALTKQGFVVFAHDHFGHGHTSGDLKDIQSFDILPQDTIFHIEERRSLYPDLPIFLLGHSLGGLITLDVVLKASNLIHGIILISPAMKPSPETATPLRIKIGKMLSVLCPKVIIVRLDSEKVTRNKARIQKYSDDPLVHVEIRAGFVMMLLNAQVTIERRLHEITLPMFVIHGSGDMLTHISGSHELIEKISSTDKTLKEVVGAYHQVHHEPDGVGEEALNSICDWINQRLNS